MDFKTYIISERTGWGDGYDVAGDGNPFINLFQHGEAILNGHKINFSCSFHISSTYDINIIFKL